MKFVKRIIRISVMLGILLFLFSSFVYGLEHKHTYTALYSAKPTCTDKGYTVFSCDCGKTYKGSYENALGHNFSKNMICFKEPTCTAKGKGGRYCQRCYAKTDIVYYNKVPHNIVNATVKSSSKRNGETRRECKVCKKVYKRSVINKISTVKLEKKSYIYNGSRKTPAVIVKDAGGKKLIKNTDYSLEYQKGRKYPGIYNVKVIFKGNYQGEKNLKFTITPKAVKNIVAYPSASSAVLSWDESKGADGYEIYLKEKKLKLLKDTVNFTYTVNKIDGKKLESGTDYTFIIRSYKKADNKKLYSADKKVKVSVKPDKSRIKKIGLSAGKVTVIPLKQSCHGYEILLSTNKSFSNAKAIKIKGKNTAPYTFGNLVKGQKYYVKMRAYVISGGEKYYGYYSDVKIFKA